MDIDKFAELVLGQYGNLSESTKDGLEEFFIAADVRSYWEA